MATSDDWVIPADCVRETDRIDDSSTVLRVAAIQCFVPKKTITPAQAVPQHGLNLPQNSTINSL
ncbi:MAG: hypothetical protein CBE43_03305 [Rhodopirellula sp. TMED283]|nr:MAG: hypothetical protein CBE43_03305 [Rhodopirellula sp. TMED283]